MEEAEALGTKMTIMVAGKLKCFGTTLQIKEKYGQGFQVEIKVD
jgi:ATP-binding cassette subfamily A (ABC1) protein 3